MFNILHLFILIELLLFDRINSLSKNFNNSKSYSINNNTNIKRKLEEEFRPIKIYFDTKLMEENSLSDDPETKELVLDGLNTAKRVIERLFMIKNNENKVNFNEYKQIIKNKYNKISDFNKVDADLVIFVDYGTLGSSPQCDENSQILKGSKTERPTIGYIKINSNKFSGITEDYSKSEFYKYYMLHQTTHILGFKRSILEDHLEEQTFNRFGKEYKKEIIKTDSLMSFAREYFDCSDETKFKGIEIEEMTEDNYPNCNEYIHWDSRILSGDYMTYDINVQDQVISEFTLYLLEDTQFYKVNKFTGGLMRFGKHVGCSFFELDCNEQLSTEEIGNKTTTRKSVFPNEFCSGKSKTTCSPCRQSRGVCDLYSAVEKVTKTRGGFYLRNDWTGDYGNKFADFCPLSLNEKEAPEKKNEFSYIGNCKLGNKNFGQFAFSYWNTTYSQNNYSTFSNTYGESFSENSFCAFSSVIHISDKNKFYKGFVRPTCYEMYCSDSSLTIKIRELYTVCPRGGGYISIEGKSSNYIGHLLCPDYNLICSQNVTCNNMFDCVEKNSTMKLNPKYDYILNDDVSTQIILPDTTKTYPKAYEIADNGICPRNCSQCNENHQCFECNVSTPYYLGVKEGDSNPIICAEIPPINNYYYNHTNISFYKCKPNCKVCSDATYCNQCGPKYKLNDPHTECIPRIIGCGKYNESSNYTDNVTNGGGQGYRECEKCNETGGFHCFDFDMETCKKVPDDINTYFNNSFGCLQKCESKFPNCYNCSEENCYTCKEGYYANNTKACLKKVEHCEIDNIASNSSECNKCIDNSTVKYRCLNHVKSKCNLIEDINLYFKVDYGDDTNDCVKKCSDEYDPKCNNCTHEKCLNCTDNHFPFQNKCIEGIEHCEDHYYNINNNTKYCKKCRAPFYCFKDNLNVCTYIAPDKMDEYNKYTYYGTNCYQMCYDKFLLCLKCDDNACKICVNNTKPDGDHCVIDPNMVLEGDCKLQFHEINDDINSLDPGFYALKYIPNLPNSNIIDHYVNKDYTITVFIHSDCTEDLLNHGYFKINSNQLYKSVVKEFHANENITFAVFITSNLKSHFRYYDDKLKYLEVTDSSNSKNVEYTITNRYIRGINETLGPIVASLVESEKINIFERDSNVYNSYCQNVTLLSIDMPLKQRLLFLYPNSFSKRISCLGEDCEIDEYNFDESTCKCNCKIGNKLEDIFKENSTFKHYEGELEEFNNFIDSIGIIKCLGNGFSPNNMKANAGFFLVIIGIVAQIILYIFYALSGEPISSLPKGVSNPPKKNIILFSDWDKRIDKRVSSETEVFIQPRDDADEQLLEEERTYSNDGNDASNISLDTNVEGENSKKKKLKYSEKPDTKVLILFKNRGKKSKTEKDDDFKSDSEIMKLNDSDKMDKISFCKMYWYVVSLKQHIINYFSFIHCCKITKSYVPFTMKIIRSIFLFFLSFVFNILFLNQTYYEKKFNKFNGEYKFIHAEDPNLKISSGERISYAVSNTFVYAMVSFILLIIANFLVGFLFFSIRNSIEDSIKNNDNIDDLISKTKRKYLIFFIINIILMAVFLLTIAGFVGAYGGGFVDYFIGGIISLIFFEIFPFIWSLILALFIYCGNKGKTKCLTNFGKFFMF